jgi:hypothetical protein
LAQIGKTPDAGWAIKVAGRSHPMIEIDDAMAPFVEAEIKEHQAALVRQMVAVGIVIFVMLVLVGLHH